MDLDRLVALCRPCHEQTDAPYVAGRLVITALGDSRFHFEVAKHKEGHDQEISTVPTTLEAMRMAVGVRNEPELPI